MQGQLKVEAAAALVEEQLKRREAVEAEHAAGDARAAEQEAQVGDSQPRGQQTCDGIRSYQAAACMRTSAKSAFPSGIRMYPCAGCGGPRPHGDMAHVAMDRLAMPLRLPLRNSDVPVWCLHATRRSFRVTHALLLCPLQIRGWRERTAEVVEAKDARVRAVMDKYGMLRKAVAEYNRRLEAAAGAPLPSLEAEEGEGPADTAPWRDAGGSSGFHAQGRGALAAVAAAASGLQGLSLQG